MQMTEIAIGLIRPSPTNPRKSFGALDELAASIKEHGLISPVTVRPLPEGMFELVAGERRWRAAKKAKLAALPAIVRELDDKQVLEIQLIENLQRADVHPVEEADGYEALLERHGYDVDGLAAKIGKSASYVYGRLKLGALAPYPREEFLADRLSASIALLIARIPDAALQERATREVLGEHLENKDAGALDVDAEDPASTERRRLAIKDADDLEVDGPYTLGSTGDRAYETQPMSYREAQIHLRRRYMLRLELATFEVADPQLVPSAGACTSCPHRTGNQRELFAEVTRDDLCTSPSCYERKTAAAWDAKARAAEAEGRKVLPRDKTERMFSPVDGRTILGGSPYVDPRDHVPSDLVPIGAKPPTWEKLLGKKLEQPTVLVQDQTGAPRALIDRAAAVKALRDAGKVDKPLKPAPSKGSDTDAFVRQAEKDERERSVRRLAHETLAAAVGGALKKLSATKSAAVWRWIVREVVDEVSLDAMRATFGDPDLELDDGAAGAKTAEDAMVRLAISVFDQLTRGAMWVAPRPDGPLMQAVKLLGLDYEGALESAEVSVDQAREAEKKIDEKKPAKAKAKAGKKAKP